MTEKELSAALDIKTPNFWYAVGKRRATEDIETVDAYVRNEQKKYRDHRRIVFAKRKGGTA
jgi:hypothetical protein